MSEKRQGKTEASIRLACEIGPSLLFFAAARWQGVPVGTAVFMAAAVLAVGVEWYRKRHVPIVPTFGASLALVLGGGTLAFDRPDLIAMQPTIANTVTAIALAAMLLRGRLVLESVFDVVVAARDEAWRRVTWCVVGYLIVLAVLNEVVRHVWTIDVWIAFKAFGIPVLDGAAVAAAWAYLRAHPDDRGAETGDAADRPPRPGVPTGSRGRRSRRGRNRGRG